ncbi:MAG: hypothetical protein AAGI15_15650, partial [Pseudomonadota bacterium]
MSYRARVTIKRNGRILYREGKTFSRRRDAVTWGAKRDKELVAAVDAGDLELKEATGEAERNRTMPLRAVIDHYRAEYSASFGRTVGKDLALLARSQLASLPISEITSQDIVSHVKRRRDGYT